MRLVALICGLSGCSLFLADELPPDASVDGETGELFQPFGDVGLISVDSIPDVSLEIEGMCTITTSDTIGADCAVQRGVVGALAIARARTVTINGMLRVVGDRPLVILAETITVGSSGIIDASSQSGVQVGGAGHRSCDPISDATGLTGAGGGGFVSAGGAGGGATTVEGVGGATEEQPTTLVGGCDGGDASAAPGGNGGGAIQLVALDTLVVEGLVVAGGAGGRGSVATNGGGGGGGAGGMIVLDSPNIDIANAQLGHFGGGGGSGSFNGPPSGDGGDGGIDGGAGGVDANAGDGGDGGGPARIAGEPGVTAAGGAGHGGGGGGIGVLIEHDPTR